MERMLRTAHEARKLREVHVADVFNHKANDGNRYIINPPGADVTVHQHNEIGHGEVPWDVVFSTLRDIKFDGVLSVCVFGWHERAGVHCLPAADGKRGWSWYLRYLRGH